MKELPHDWDALWLGGTEMKVEGYSTMLKRLKEGTGGYGVLFRETMYDAIIEQLEKEMHQADINYLKLMSKFNCFKSVKNIIYHLPGYSTIQKCKVDYPDLYR